MRTNAVKLKKFTYYKSESKLELKPPLLYLVAKLK